MSILRCAQFRLRCGILAALLPGLLAGCQKSKSPDKKEVPEEVPQVQLLMEPAQVKLLVKDPGTRILDVRSEAAYKAGHVPGAVHVDVGAWKAQALKDDGNGLRDKAAWQAMARKLGLNELTQVVVYADAKRLTNATRIWWTLKYLGVEAAGILNGGWDRWKESDGESSQETPAVKPGNFEVEFKLERLATADALQDAKSKDLQIVDARSESEVKAGKVPGAVPLEWVELTNGDGTLKSPDELRRIFAAAKLAPDKPAATYCYSGGRASLDAFALEVAGFKNVKNYYCGWQQWGAGKRPVEKPAKK